MLVGISVEFKDGCFPGTDGRIQQDGLIAHPQIFPSVLDRIVRFQTQPFGGGDGAFYGFDVHIDPVDRDLGIEFFKQEPH
mgnify:CR=1 FL=1